jgi:hypothetical protein
MLKLFHLSAILAAVVFFAAILGVAFYSSPYSNNPNEQKTAAEQQSGNQEQKNGITGSAFWRFLFPDSISVFTLLLVIATIVLAIVAVVQIGFLTRQEEIAITAANAAKDSADAAKQSAEISQRALIVAQRAYVRVVGYPWLWRPDADPKRSGKYWYDITPTIENVGNTPAAIKIIMSFALRDTQLPDDFDFPYRGTPGDSIIGPKQTISTESAVILDEDLAAVRDGKKFFYIWGAVTYKDGFEGTPVHRTEFCADIHRVFGNPLDPRDPTNPKGTNVEIRFGIYPKHNKID